MPLSVDPSAPVKILVDLQSRHFTGYQVWLRNSATEGWRFLKEGSRDSVTVVPSIPEGAECAVDFFFFSGNDGQDFKAMVVFEQFGKIVDDGAIQVTAGDADRFVQTRVNLS